MNKNRVDIKTIENDEKYLRQISKPIDFQTTNYKEAIQKLDYFCQHDDNILALASIQIGIPLRLIYLKKTDLTKFEDKNYNEAKILINPKILSQTGKTLYWEACASCLENTGLVARPYQIEIEYYDEEKKKHHETFVGFAATVLSHELDHLDGILHIDIATEIRLLNHEERKELRQKEPYKVLRKKEPFHNNKTHV